MQTDMSSLAEFYTQSKCKYLKEFKNFVVCPLSFLLSFTQNIKQEEEWEQNNC